MNDAERFTNVVHYAGKAYVIDTCNVPSIGWETMAFASQQQLDTDGPANVDWDKVNWRDLCQMRTTDKEIAKKNHDEVVSNIGRYAPVRKRG